MADKGKAPASSPPKTASRERSRSPAESRRVTTTTAALPQQLLPPPPPPLVAAPEGMKCPLCPSVFRNSNALHGHLHVHSRAPTNSTATEVWQVIMEMFNGHPPQDLVELFRPQLEHERRVRAAGPAIPVAIRHGRPVVYRIPGGGDGGADNVVEAPPPTAEGGAKEDEAGPSTSSLARGFDLNTSVAEEEEEKKEE